MDTRQERLSRLDNALLNKQQICSSEGVLSSFPTVLKEPFMIDGVGLVICRQGSFTFILNQKSFSAKAGDTLFLPKDSLFQVLYSSADVEVFIFIYQTDPIRDIIGNSVVSMNLYSHLATEPCYVWNTREEDIKELRNYKKWLISDERKIPKDKRDFVGKCLDSLESRFREIAHKVTDKVLRVLHNPKIKEQKKEEIKQRARVSIREKLAEHQRQIRTEKEMEIEKPIRKKQKEEHR